MTSRTSEKAFEDSIEKHLLESHKYLKVESSDYDAERGIFPSEVLTFIQNTQMAQWEKVYKQYGMKASQAIFDDLTANLNSVGALVVLRHGFKCLGRIFKMAYFAPANSMNEETQKLYGLNRFGVCRQLHYSKLIKNSHHKKW